MNQLLGICGQAGHGKDAIAKVLVDSFGWTRVAFADAVREMAIAIDPYVDCANPAQEKLSFGLVRLSFLVEFKGWDEAKKSPDVRRLLQRIGTEGVRKIIGEDTWIDIALEKATKIKGNVVISDVRFPNEALAIQEIYGDVWRVSRPSHMAEGIDSSHASESSISKVLFDLEIINDGTLEDLSLKVEDALTKSSLNCKAFECGGFVGDIKSTGEKPTRSDN